MNITILDNKLTRGRQSWKREQLVEMHGEKLRVVVERDSYDVQSRLFVDVWNPSDRTWNRMHTLEGREYGYLVSAYSKDDAEINRQSDSVIKQLLDYAGQVIA